MWLTKRKDSSNYNADNVTYRRGYFIIRNILKTAR